MEKFQSRIADILTSKSKIRYVGEKTDITFSTKGRKWISCSGKNNYPDGEVFTSPVLEGTEGVLHVTQVYLMGLGYRNLEFK